MSDIFISYAREDRPRAESLAHALEAQGWLVWWDRDIQTGKNPDEEIEAALAAAKCVIVLWSKVSVDSRWVRNEAEEGAARDLLFPVLIEKDVRIPLAFKGIQAADLAGWDGTVGAAPFQSLVADIAQHLVAEEKRREAEAEAKRRAEAEDPQRRQAEAQRRAEDEDRQRREAEAEAQRRAVAAEEERRHRVRRRALWIIGTAGAISVAGVAIVAVVLLGGDRDTPPHPPERPSAELTAAPVAIRRGQTVTLSWTTTNATEVRLEPGLGTVPAQGSRQVSPQQLTAYRLVASGVGGTVEDTVRIAVRGLPRPAPTARLEANPAVVQLGQPVTLQWTTTNASSVRLEPGLGSVALRGSRQVSPQQDITYRVVASGSGQSIEAAAQVSVRQPPPPPVTGCTIVGRVYNRDTNTPLIGIRILLDDGRPPSSARVLATSGTDGRFSASCNGFAPQAFPLRLRVTSDGWRCASGGEPMTRDVPEAIPVAGSPALNVLVSMREIARARINSCL